MYIVPKRDRAAIESARADDCWSNGSDDATSNK